MLMKNILLTSLFLGLGMIVNAQCLNDTILTYRAVDGKNADFKLNLMTINMFDTINRIVRSETQAVSLNDSNQIVIRNGYKKETHLFKNLADGFLISDTFFRYYIQSYKITEIVDRIYNDYDSLIKQDIRKYNIYIPNKTVLISRLLTENTYVNNQLIKIKESRIDTQNYIINTSKYRYGMDGVIEKEKIYFDSNNIYTTIQKTYYSYTNHLLSHSIDSSKQNDLPWRESSRRNFYTHNSENLLSETLIETQINGKWLRNFTESYVYNKEGILIENVWRQYYIHNSQDLFRQTQNSWTYNSDKLLSHSNTIFTTHFDNGITKITTYTSDYLYNEQGQEVEVNSFKDYPEPYQSERVITKTNYDLGTVKDKYEYFYFDSTKTEFAIAVKTTNNCKERYKADPPIEFNIYPNPTIDILNIDLETGTEFTIYDMNASIVFKGKIENSKTILDISNFAVGIYVVRANGEKKRFVKM